MSRDTKQSQENTKNNLHSSKSILVIDTPDSCEECPLRSYSNLALWCTPLRKTKEKDDVCPLRPLPKKKNTLLTEYNLIEAIYENGWNACIEELEK